MRDGRGFATIGDINQSCVAQKGGAPVEDLLRQLIDTTRQMTGQIGAMESRISGLAERQAANEKRACGNAEKLDRVLANQDRMKWALRLGGSAAVGLAGLAAWIWDHWPLFGGR